MPFKGFNRAPQLLIRTSEGDFTIQHLRVLDGVRQEQSYREMAAELERSVAWVSKLVKYLLGRELLERIPKKNGESNTLRLTLHGKQALEEYGKRLS